MASLHNLIVKFRFDKGKYFNLRIGFITLHQAAGGWGQSGQQNVVDTVICRVYGDIDQTEPLSCDLQSCFLGDFTKADQICCDFISDHESNVTNNIIYIKANNSLFIFMKIDDVGTLIQSCTIPDVMQYRNVELGYIHCREAAPFL